MSTLVSTYYCCLVNLIDVTLAVADVKLKLVDVVASADVDIEEGVEDRLVTADSLAATSHVLLQLDNSF